MARSKLDPIIFIENKREALVLALNAHAPHDVVNDKELCSAFLEFFRRGSKQDLKAFHEHFSSKSLNLSLSNSSAALSDAPSSPVVTLPSYTRLDVTAPICLAQQSILGSTSVWPSTASPFPQRLPSPLAQKYFETRVNRDRLPRLVRAAEGFTAPNNFCQELLCLATAPEGLTAPNNSFLEDLSKIWSATEGPFASYNKSACRIERLYQGRNKIKQKARQCEIADHIAHLFFAHEVEEHGRVAHTLLQGQGRTSAAFKIIAANANVQVNDVRQEYKYCKNYKHLLMKGGSGSFLLLGSKVTTLWERNLILEDVDLLLEFRKTCYPDIEKACRRLSEIARPLIVSGLLAYGWTLDELKPSELIHILDKEAMENSSLALGGCSKRLRWDEDREHAQRQESDNSQGSKRQRREDSRFDDCNQLSRNSQPSIPTGDETHTVFTGMINPQIIGAQGSPNESVPLVNGMNLGDFLASNMLELPVPAIIGPTNGTENSYENSSSQNPQIGNQISTIGSVEGTHIGPMGPGGNTHGVSRNVHSLFDIVYNDDWVSGTFANSQAWNLDDFVQEQGPF